jgi:hypothetical protein
MGSGRWSTDVYDAAARMRRRTGRSAFAYSDSGARRVHEALNPYGVVRESRDSDEHPQSLAIAVLFDVTGSMRHVPRVLQAKLPGLLGLLLRTGVAGSAPAGPDGRSRGDYVAHPQIMFGAIGDATCDRVPLQIGQFESDNRMDDDLGRIVLEGGGGGQMTESYELAMYFMARHTSIDCFEKRAKRGYLFVIGDEMPYPRVSRRQVGAIIGDGIDETIDTEAIVAELSQRYHVYYILPSGSSYVGNATVLERWRGLLGQHVIELDDLDAVCETIALTIGLNEGAIDLDEGLADLAEMGSGAGGSVGRALAGIPAARFVTGPYHPAHGPGRI